MPSSPLPQLTRPFVNATGGARALLEEFDAPVDLGVPGAHYVLVVPVCKKTGKLLMVRKTKPRWQAGLLNYPGGKVEEAESPRAAAVRELQEETDLLVPPDALVPLALLSRHEIFRMHVFAVELEDAQAARTMTEEPVELVSFLDVVTGAARGVENIGWLALLALDGSPSPKIAEVHYA